MSDIWINVISRVHRASWHEQTSILFGKNCKVGHYPQTFQPDCCIPTMLIGIINPLYLSSKNLAPIISQSSRSIWFSLTCCWDLVWWTSYSFYLTWLILKGENCSYVISSQGNHEHQLAFRYLQISFFRTWYDSTKHDYTLQFDFSLNYLDWHSRSQACKTPRICAIILLESSVKEPELVWWFITYVREKTAKKKKKKKSPVRMENMDFFTICSSC